MQLTVRARRRILAGRAHGRVLDLGGAASHQALWERVPRVVDVVHMDGPSDPALASLDRSDDRFDTVFSVFQMASARPLGQLLDRVRSLLSDEGVLLFLEPGRLTGASGRAQRMVAPGVAAATGWRVHHDIPQRLRDAHLSVTDLERHRPGTVQWWIRTLVEGTAQHSLLDP